MTNWDIVDSAATDDGTVLVLVKADDIWEVRVEHHLLMASDEHRSEDALSTLTLERAPHARRVLIGGLGMGYTLRSTLDGLPADATVVMAEMSPALVGWNRDVFGSLAGHPLRDPRVELRVGDVGARIREATESYDAILLDVDNGPEAMTHQHNSALYDEAGLAACFNALRPDGVLSIWSAGSDDDFVIRLKKAGFATEAVAITIDDDEPPIVFLAKKPATA